jgi:hypothetical protein
MLLLAFFTFTYGSINMVNPNTKVRGVNLGGWLVAEYFLIKYRPWITPTLFESIDCPDEYSIGMKLGHDLAVKYLTDHWGNGNYLTDQKPFIQKVISKELQAGV